MGPVGPQVSVANGTSGVARTAKFLSPFDLNARIEILFNLNQAKGV